MKDPKYPKDINPGYTEVPGGYDPGYADVYDPPNIKDYAPEIILLLGIALYFIARKFHG